MLHTNESGAPVTVHLFTPAEETAADGTTFVRAVRETVIIEPGQTVDLSQQVFGNMLTVGELA